MFLYCSLKDTLLNYIKTPCYDISSITTHNATDVTDLVKQLPATIGNTKATDVWLCTFTQKKPRKKSTKKKSQFEKLQIFTEILSTFFIVYVFYNFHAYLAFASYVVIYAGLEYIIYINLNEVLTFNFMSLNNKFILVLICK